MSLNKVMITGNVTRDIELRYLANGTAVADMSVAVSDRYKNKAGEWVEDTTYVDVTAWSKTAQHLAENVQKGTGVFVEGHLKMESWQDKASGQKRSKLKIICDDWYPLAKRGQAQAQTERHTTTDPSAAAGGEDVPF